MKICSNLPSLSSILKTWYAKFSLKKDFLNVWWFDSFKLFEMSTSTFLLAVAVKAIKGTTGSISFKILIFL